MGINAGVNQLEWQNLAPDATSQDNSNGGRARPERLVPLGVNAATFLVSVHIPPEADSDLASRPIGRQEP